MNGESICHRAGGAAMSDTKELLFEIRVLPADGKALIMADSPPERAEARRDFPDLAAYTMRVQEALMLGAKVRRSGRPGVLAAAEADPTIFRELGGTLFEWVLPPDVLALYRRTLDAAEKAVAKVRFNLRIETPALANVPWETLYDPNEKRYLSLSPRILVTRGVEPLDLRISSARPLRILIIVANPTHERRLGQVRQLAPLDADAEVGRIRKTLRSLVTKRAIELSQVRLANKRELFKSLRDARLHQKPFDIVHFIGHGDFDEQTGMGYLLFRGQGGTEADHVYADDFCDILDECRPKLVILNSCRGAMSDRQDLFSSTAAMVIKRKMPAVVAMQYEISDDAAQCFSKEFYYWLAEGLPIHEALSAARREIKDLGPEWITPVLFMRSIDGQFLAAVSGGGT
jgi:hypothetical protein